MTPADRQKVTKAFNDAVANSPYAEEVIKGWFTNEGDPMTRRKLVEISLKSEEFFAAMDEMLSRGEVTLDQYLVNFDKAMKKSIYDNK